MEQILGFTSKKTSTALELQHPCDLWGKELHLKILCNSRGNLQVQQIYPTWEWGASPFSKGEKIFIAAGGWRGRNLFYSTFWEQLPSPIVRVCLEKIPSCRAAISHFFIYKPSTGALRVLGNNKKNTFITPQFLSSVNSRTKKKKSYSF